MEAVWIPRNMTGPLCKQP